MRDADGTIERLLAGLRDAEPPGGMEHRILEALDGMGAREVGSLRFALAPAVASGACDAVGVCGDPDGCFYCQQRKHVPGQLCSSHSSQSRAEWGTQHCFIPTGGPKAPARIGGSEGSFDQRDFRRSGEAFAGCACGGGDADGQLPCTAVAVD